MNLAPKVGCTSSLWGVRLGLYLRLMQNASRQMLKLSRNPEPPCLTHAPGPNRTHGTANRTTKCYIRATPTTALSRNVQTTGVTRL
ncbi:hypothetical protein PAQ31011_03439 [Pandoraea aquatica]|uniref:Uncharacterized protein n=1 Tax=Pandoraea aquatica TaxID=2508290 RepID=A0A5E4WNM6_9BURK|nr:hypothetical protein PAQ31011_03439 [Pandoraea aquatica]